MVLSVDGYRAEQGECEAGIETTGRSGGEMGVPIGSGAYFDGNRACEGGSPPGGRIRRGWF